MPSSISNSSQRAPHGPWPWIGFGALLCAAAALAATEYAARKAGHLPSVVDDRALWSQVRGQVAQADAKTIVLLGASRIQLGVSPSILRQEFPQYEVFQLAVEGSSPIATLRDLAADDRFHGVVVCAMTASFARKNRHEEQGSYPKFYHRKWSIDQQANRRIRTALQERFVICNPSFNLVRVFGYLAAKRHLPPPLHVITNSDRSRVADFTKYFEPILRERAEASRSETTRSHRLRKEVVDELLQDIRVVRPMAKAIEARGGRVVFLRMPTRFRGDGERDFWNRLPQSVAADVIDFERVPTMERMKCPDGNHLDGSDIRGFTISLAHELREHGITP